MRIPRVSHPEQRRTQAERRAATRLALLEATIDCLVEFGYASVTSSQIAARAGVTRGAQAYYFATKAELVVAALEHVTDTMVDQFRADPPTRADAETEADLVMSLLDRLWQLHDSPAFTATAELLNASRTDSELRAHTVDLNRRLTATMTEVAEEMVPGISQDPGEVSLMITALAAVRGIMQLGHVVGEGGAEALWQATRSQLEILVGTAATRRQDGESGGK